MAVAFEIYFRGGTTEQYEQVIARMGFAHEGAGAPGGLFHWVTQTDDGLEVTDVWRSDEEFERFAEEQIGPYTQEAGLAEPQITRHEVHNFLTAG